MPRERRQNMLAVDDTYGEEFRRGCRENEQA